MRLRRFFADLDCFPFKDMLCYNYLSGENRFLSFFASVIGSVLTISFYFPIYFQFYISKKGESVCEEIFKISFSDYSVERRSPSHYKEKFAAGRIISKLDSRKNFWIFVPETGVSKSCMIHFSKKS